jgi:hypothetical protein
MLARERTSWMSMQGLKAATDICNAPALPCLTFGDERARKGLLHDESLKGSSSHWAECRGADIQGDTGTDMLEGLWCAYLESAERLCSGTCGHDVVSHQSLGQVLVTW